MNQVQKRQMRPDKETIHSGHFMVSHFEAESQDDFDDLVTVPDEEQNVPKVSVVTTYTVPGVQKPFPPTDRDDSKQHQQLSIEISLNKLFKCMTLAYRQKLTSPKWNRFKGVKLRWKDKIRLNNVIWRCWHMQFIKKQNTLVCQFASPLDVDTHVKPETTILEGKYWKRRAEAVIAEYKKWRKFHIMRLLGKGDTSVQDTVSDMDMLESFSQCSELAGTMLADEDYLNFMTDTLFSTITSHQPFAFPDCREIARGASLADFIQPSLGPLQPNLEDFMDTLEPIQAFPDLLSTPRLASVPEESAIPSDDALYRSGMSVDSYPTGYNQSTAATMPTSQMTIHGASNSAQMMPMGEQTIKNEQMRMYDNERMFAADIPANMSTNMSPNMLSSEMLQYSSYEPHTPPDQHMTDAYGPKNSRLQYVNTPKLVTQPESSIFNKYTGVSSVPPSQTAPETVSLLQQPMQTAKYASTIVIQGRAGYSREKPRQRSHYPIQITNNQYYGQSGGGYESRGSGAGTPSSGGGGGGAGTRPSAPQLQYLSSAPDYKPKPQQGARSFKMPSPPASVAPQVVNAGSPGSSGGNGSRKQDQYRSHSLPLGAQLNADWSVTTAATSHSHAPVEAAHHAPRAREPPGAGAGGRVRSRSTSGGGEASGSARGSARRPPPLTSVASEPTLPQASVMLAQLLSAQHSTSLYKLNSSEEVLDPTKSPGRLAQPSPIGSDVMSPHHSLSPPTSPGSPRAGSPREPRRTHLHAEQKRRYNIKNGFDTLQALIPHLNANPSAKISKAAMLQKGAEYIKQLKAERNQIKEEMESLRQQIECLNNSISNCHSLLPATGAPVSRARAGRLREMFARHVANRTMHNWKYWLFSVVSAALVESFSACVSCGSGADLVRTTLLWAEQHCSLVEMRPAVLNSLRVLCTSTDMLTNPERLPEEARAAVAASAGVKSEPT